MVERNPVKDVKDSFCVIPFIHLEARADGYVAPCCMSQHYFAKPDGTKFTLARDTLTDVWNSDALQELRDALKNGVKHPACSACWREDAVGKKSKRVRENERFWNHIERVMEAQREDLQPIFLDIKLGNLCNLKCRICAPHSSSKWIKEWIDVYKWDMVGTTAQEASAPGSELNRRMIMNWFEYNPKFWDALEAWLPHIEKFEIYGGEPFLIERHFEMLRKSVENGWSKNQNVHYNSNGTILPVDAMENIFPHFKRVDIMLSIDGVGEQFEYQRYGAKWDEVERNMIALLNKFGPRDIQICLTVSNFNVYYLPDYLKYFHSVGIPVWVNVLYTEKPFSIYNLPMEAKLAVKERLESMGTERDILTDPIDGVINYMMNTPADERAVELVDRIRKHDVYRNQDFAETFPEWAKLIGYSKNA